MSSSHKSEFVCRWEPTVLASTLLSAPSREVLSQWISAVAFLDENQHPVLLAMNNQAEPNFSQLVQSVNAEYAPSVVLGELLRKGLVEQLDSGQVLLRRSSYVQDVPGFEVSPQIRRQKHSPGRSAGRRHNDDI